MSATPKIESMLAMAEKLSAVLAADIVALERGAPREMKTLDPEFQLLCSEYRRQAAQLGRAELQAAPDELRKRLTAATKAFHDTLTRHGHMLMRVRNCSEGLIRAVAEEVEKRRNRARPYGPTPGGRPAAPRPAGSAMIYNAVV